MGIDIISGNIEEEVFRIFDDYLFDLEGEDRAADLDRYLSLVENLDQTSVLDQQINSGVKRAVAAYFPPRRKSS